MMDERKFGDLVVDWTIPPEPSDKIFTGRFAQLEPLDANTHAQDLFAANKASDLIWDYLAYGPFETLAEYSDWIASVANKSDPKFYAVRDLEKDKTLGVMSFLRIEPEAGSIEVGHINWSPALQKTPAATETIYLMMRWAFENGYRRFEWKCNALNLGSRRAAERFGFSFEGVFRQHLIAKGRNRDTAWFACIDAEWPDLRAAYEWWLDADNFDASGRQKSSLSHLTRAILVANDPMLKA